ncbi:hypothetical protein HDV05_000310 [Chytridiales sp. JEL 0842]|nr:hypothetical protein HDV05_000310 [Chytridiales sp. JEL 0842]
MTILALYWTLAKPAWPMALLYVILITFVSSTMMPPGVTILWDPKLSFRRNYQFIVKSHIFLYFLGMPVSIVITYLLHLSNTLNSLIRNGGDIWKSLGSIEVVGSVIYVGLAFPLLKALILKLQNLSPALKKEAARRNGDVVDRIRLRLKFSFSQRSLITVVEMFILYRASTYTTFLVAFLLNRCVQIFQRLLANRSFLREQQSVVAPTPEALEPVAELAEATINEINGESAIDIEDETDSPSPLPAVDPKVLAQTIRTSRVVSSPSSRSPSINVGLTDPPNPSGSPPKPRRGSSFSLTQSIQTSPRPIPRSFTAIASSRTTTTHAALQAFRTKIIQDVTTISQLPPVLAYAIDQWAQTTADMCAYTSAAIISLMYISPMSSWAVCVGQVDYAETVYRLLFGLGWMCISDSLMTKWEERYLGFEWLAVVKRVEVVNWGVRTYWAWAFACLSSLVMVLAVESGLWTPSECFEYGRF